MLPQLPRLSDYDVSPQNGFLPSEIPLESLPDAYYAPWETVIKNMQGLMLSRRLRGIVDALPVLSTGFLVTEAEWRRAHQVLSFLAHAYIWGGDEPAEIVPPTLSIPYLETCHHLELPTVATYAALTLWNWRPLFPDEPIDSLENLTTLHTFTGSLDESWFFLISVAIEARGAMSIPLMLDATAAAREDDVATVTERLRSFAELLDELGSMLQRMYENCDPHIFYHRIRPFFAGSKNMADAGLPNGVMFDDGTGNAPFVQFSGASNAQSSLIQFFDLILGVEHRPTGVQGPSSPAAPQEGVSPPGPTNNFLTDMQSYMPGPHRRFLAHVAGVANIRDYVAARPHNRALCTAFDACLAMLRAFRDKHIQMVTRYIVLKSRESRAVPQHAPTAAPSAGPASASAPAMTTGTTSAAPPVIPPRKRLNLATKKSKGAKGTGGTALIPFLKQARDETGEPAIDAWARRLLSNGPGNAGLAPAAAKATRTGDGVARLGKVNEHPSGEVEVVGLAGTWSVDDSEGGICHW